MNTSDILVFGTAVVGIGLLLLGAVLLELRAKARGAGVLVGVGLGLGILAFAAKLALIVGFGLLGDRYLARFLPRDLKPEPYADVPAAPVATGLAGAGYVWEALPPLPPEPADNPTTADKVALGERLFHDPRLSADDTVACASCHDVAGAGGGDGRPVPLGIRGQRGNRNAPTVLNAAYQAVLFWDGRAASLEQQALGPPVNPVEMGMADLDALAAKLTALPEYRTAFARAFGGERPVTAGNIARAIAAYERTLVTPDTPYDRFVRGDTTALTAQQLRGMALFAQFGCVLCHRGPNFSDASLIGGALPYRPFPAVPGTDYEARYHLADDTGLAADGRGVWRIPSLRNVTRTAPYFHNGAVDDLREAIRIMARVQLNKPAGARPEDDWRVTWSPATRATTAQPDAALGEAEVEDLAAFLHALEGEVGCDCRGRLSP